MNPKFSASANAHKKRTFLKRSAITFLKLLLSPVRTDKKTIIFESDSDFTDSSKALYDYLKNHHYDDQYNIYWAVGNLKLAKEKHPDIKSFSVSLRKGQIFSYLHGIYIQTRAKYTFYTHRYVGNEFKRSQFRTFITHAAPPVKNSSGFFGNPSKNTGILSTSKFAANYRCKTLGGGHDKVIITGLPRNDLLFTADRSTIKKKLNIDAKKIIIWMPTFKHHKNKKRVDFDNQIDISILTNDNLKLLQRELEKNNISLIIKPHPAQDMNALKISESKNIKIIENSSLERQNIQPYSLLAISDALITDFSSVYFDYLLIDKPIAFELADKETYEKGIGFIFDKPLNYMPGHKIYDIKDFIKFIDEIAKNEDPFKSERNELKNLNHNYQDGHSTERVLKHFNLIK